MPDTAATRVCLSTVGDLMASIPAMLGFHPDESLILICLDKHNRVQLTTRVDLPAPQDARALVAALSGHSMVRAAHRILAVVVADTDHAAVVGDLGAELARLSIPLEGFHIPACTAGALWTRHGSTDTGTLPDPAASVLAAHRAAEGDTVHHARGAIAATFAPEDPAALTRRAQVIDALLATPLPALEEAATVVRAALRDAHHGKLSLTDERVAELAIALSDPTVRDAALATAIPATSALPRAARQLWTRLTRLTPEPERAQPAVLVGHAAYTAGDGATARIALDIAREADPGHVLAGLLLRALDGGVHPTQLASLAQHDPFGLRHARDHQQDDPATTSDTTGRG